MAKSKVKLLGGYTEAEWLAYFDWLENQPVEGCAPEWKERREKKRKANRLKREKKQRYIQKKLKK